MKLIHALLSLAVAAALPLRAQTITETFDSNSLGSSLQIASGTNYNFYEGKINLDGWYTEWVEDEGDGHEEFRPPVWIVTNFSGYYDVSLTAEVVFRTGSSDGAMFHFGFGTLGTFTTPGQPGNYFLGLRFQSTNVGGVIRVADLDPTGSADGAIVGSGSTSGESLARIVWNGTTKTATFLVDIGNDGTFDVTSSAINGADNGYTASNLLIGFGGGLGSYVTNFTVAPTAVPEPSTYALWAGLAACAGGLLRRRPRRV